MLSYSHLYRLFIDNGVKKRRQSQWWWRKWQLECYYLRKSALEGDFKRTFLQIFNLHSKSFAQCSCAVYSVHVMNEPSMQTGVCTDHCNYGALGESSFLCRFICHINKWISGMFRGRWQREKFEKINELWQCCTWGRKSVAISSGLCWHRVGQIWKTEMERGQWLSVTALVHASPQLSCHFLFRYCAPDLLIHNISPRKKGIKCMKSALYTHTKIRCAVISIYRMQNLE